MYTRWCRGGTKRDVDHDFVVDRMPHKGAEEGGRGGEKRIRVTKSTDGTDV